ncbi:translation initiation factor IF-2 [Aureococcus anophagefferens]|nr:translation initiation factor IF-2 [Aureococcus anophagefferens]
MASFAETGDPEDAARASLGSDEGAGNLHDDFRTALEKNADIQPSKIGKLIAHVPTPNLKKAITKNLKRPERKDRENIKGKVIDGKHEQYVLTLGMMMGIRQTLLSQANDIDADTAAAAPRPEALAVGDFLECRKYVFPPKGSSTTPPHSLAHTFKFKDYAPEAFSRIRDIFDQYFFYSHDGKFLIKTQTQEEVKFLRRMLPAYYAHLKKHPGSLMTRYLGMSRIKFYHLRRKVRFVVMHSVHPTPLHVHRTYDLKGCTHGRRTTEKERDRDVRLGIGLHLKDLDLVDDDFRLALRARRARRTCS